MYRSVVQLLIVIAFGVVISGCNAFSWLPFVDASDPQRVKADKPTPLLEFDAEAAIVIRWSQKVGRGLGKKYLDIAPGINEDTVYAADAYGIVAAFDRVTGAKRWETRVGRPERKSVFDVTDRSDPSFVSGGVGVAQGLVVVGTINGEVIALSAANGDARWRSSLSGEILAAPAIGRDVVVVQSSDGRIAALEIDTGEKRWVYNSVDPIVTLRGTASPTINSGFIYTGLANGTVVAIDVQSGEVQWESRIALPEGTSELERMVDVDGRPLVEQGLIFAASHQGKTRALRQADGNPIWEVSEPSFRSIGSGQGLVYVVTDEDSVVAIDQSRAEIAWRQDQLKRRVLTDPLAYGNYVVVGDEEGYLHVIAQSDGRFVARRKVGSALRSEIVESDGLLYVFDRSGKLSVLSIARD